MIGIMIHGIVCMLKKKRSLLKNKIMLKKNLYLTPQRHISFLPIIILLLTLTGCSVENSKELIGNILIERSHPYYEIFSLDYDPDSNMIYFIELNSSHSGWKSTAEKPSAILRSYNLNLEKAHPDRAKDVYTEFNVSNPESIWLQFGTDNNLYVHDIGVYDPMISTRSKPAQLIEFKNDNISSSTPILTGFLMAQEIELENKVKNYRERNKQLCSKILAKSADFIPLGYYYTDDITYTKVEHNNLLLPKYLKLKYKNTTYFVTAEDCGRENFKKYSNKFKNKKNLAQLNSTSKLVVNKKKYQINDNLYIAKKEKCFQWLMNFSCEKYSNTLNWNKNTYNLGSCAKAYMIFPTSLNTVTKDGDLIYARMKGIYTVKP